jgi:hypothetical protein
MKDSEFAKNLYNDLNETCESAGMKMLSDDWCCKLMAWLLAYGGGNEAVIFNVKLNADIKIAQKRLNLLGGEIPNIQLLGTLQTYSKELEGYLGMDKSYKEPEWIEEINTRYNLKPEKKTKKKNAK